MDRIAEHFAEPSDSASGLLELSGELLDHVVGGDATPPPPDQPPRRV